MQVKVDGKRNITLDFEAPKKFKLLQDGKEIPYLRTGKNSFRLSRNIDGVLDLEEIIEQPKIVKPMQLQAQQMALVNPNDVLMINQAAQQLEVEQNILGETQKRVEQTQTYLDVQQQRINETVLGVQGLETDNAERISATENGLFNLAGNLATTEQNLVDGIGIVNNDLQEHKSAENPHGITKKTIGLDKVDNTSDLDKPISKAVKDALDEKADKDEIQAIRDELGEYQEKNDRFTNALSNYTGGLANAQDHRELNGRDFPDQHPISAISGLQGALDNKADVSDIPTVSDATLTIQKNGTSAGTFSANASEDVNINLIIPTTASDVSALPDSTKYGAGLSLTINSTNYVMTAQLKDQNGNNLGTAQTIDLPLESVVVNGSYDSANKKIVLTLQNGTTIDIPVGDLISGLQTKITSSNKLDADLVDDSTSTNKFVTASDITAWNGKQDAISDLATIRNNATAGKSASDTIATYGDIVTHNASEFATSAQGALADSALQSGDNITELTNNAGYITGITSSDVTTALGYTPYDSANPSGYITSSALTPYVLASSLATVATSGDYDDLLNKPTLGTMASESASDYTPTSGLATVATTGAYSDLSGTPTIPTVNNPTITLSQGGVTKGTFTLNQASGATIDFDAGGGSADIDGETITRNADNELQAVAVKNKQGNSTLPLWQGTNTQWEQGSAVTWYYWENPISTTWNSSSLPSSKTWNALGYGNNMFVAFPYASNAAAFSTDAGETWSPLTLPLGLTFEGVAYGNGLFVAVASNETRTLYSSNGTNWSEGSIPSGTWVAIAYGGGKFVALAQSSATCVYSTDGTTWTSANMPSNSAWRGVAYGNGSFVAITRGDGVAAYSDNGEDWSAGLNFPPYWWSGIAYGNGVFVAVATGTSSGSNGTNQYAYSTDNGRSWNTGTLPQSATWTSISFGNGYFMAVSRNSTVSLCSRDGINWESATLPSSSGWAKVEFGNNNFVAIASGSTAAACLENSYKKCYTRDYPATTASIVYSEPNEISTYTISSVGVGTITLSDNNTYSYNSSGNTTSYASIGALHPDWLCFINSVGVKIGSTVIATNGFDYGALLQIIYPVGATYITTADTCPLATLMAGTTWTLVSSGKVLQGADSGHSAGTSIAAGLPNLTDNGAMAKVLTANSATDPSGGSGALYFSSAAKDGSSSAGTVAYRAQLAFDASRSSSIYGNSTTVQPPAYCVNIFERTA